MEMVWRAFRQEGFFRASSVHGPAALYGGHVRATQLMQSSLGEKFRETLEEIQNDMFAQQFQAEREAGYPTLSQAQAMSMGDSPLTRTEARFRTMIAGHE
jgi:ketol-acid reductoisomerase